MFIVSRNAQHYNVFSRVCVPGGQPNCPHIKPLLVYILKQVNTCKYLGDWNQWVVFSLFFIGKSESPLEKITFPTVFSERIVFEKWSTTVFINILKHVKYKLKISSCLKVLSSI